MKVKVGTIDCTPKWMGLFPLFKSWIHEGVPTQKDTTVEHMRILCKFADDVKEREPHILNLVEVCEKIVADDGRYIALSDVKKMLTDALGKIEESETEAKPIL